MKRSAQRRSVDEELQRRDALEAQLQSGPSPEVRAVLETLYAPAPKCQGRPRG